MCVCYQNYSHPDMKTQHSISYEEEIYTRQNQDITLINDFHSSMIIENKNVNIIPLDNYLYKNSLSPETSTFVWDVWP